MYVIPLTTNDVTEIASVVSSNPEVGIDMFVDETEASDIPAFVYIQEDSHSALTTLGESCVSTGASLSKTANESNSTHDSLHEVSQSNGDKDEQQSKISNSDLEDMKRMLRDIKSNPDLIYKRLCVRYDESIIERGNATMLQMEMRCNKWRFTPLPSDDIIDLF